MTDERDRQPERDVIYVGEPVNGAFTGEGIPGVLRKSTIVKNLRSQEGGDRAADAIESAYQATGTLCPVHGRLDDPIVGLLKDSVAFVCPQCSSPAMLAAWEAEGERNNKEEA